MEETLYRAKRIDDETWVEGDLLKSENRYFIVPCFGISSIENLSNRICDKLIILNAFEVKPETISRHTGLTDKNGKKIFEGDICEFSVFDYNGCDTQYKGAVVYSGSRFMLWKSNESEYYGDDGGFDLDWVVAQDDEFEVIGTIFGKPELLQN